VTLKVRYPPFETITRSSTLDQVTDSSHRIVAVAGNLLDAVDIAAGVRLLGVGVGSLGAEVAEQLSLDDLLAAGDRADEVAGPDRWVAADGAVDEIRDRFGRSAIGPAVLLGRDGLAPKISGQGQWGPDADRQGPAD
jgi:DNA polymerase-4